MRRRLLAASAIKPLWLVALALFWTACEAAPVGQIVNLSGPLFALDVNGSQRVLSVGSQVEPGETLITESKTYAQVRFIDKGVVTLRPGTQFKIESFAFDENKPESDSAAFGLLKGALRSLTGLIGKRGNNDAYRMNTATATIGIRGTQFVAEFIPEESTAVSSLRARLPLLAALDAGAWAQESVLLSDVADASPLMEVLAESFQLAQASGGGGLAPGLYVHVIDGLIQLSNRGGVQSFAAGQFGFTASVTQPPVVVPRNPGIQFTPPPAFQTSQNQAAQAPAGLPPPPPQPGPTQQQDAQRPQQQQQQQQQRQDNSGCEVR